MQAPPHNLQDFKDLLLRSWCQIQKHTYLQRSYRVQASMGHSCFMYILHAHICVSRLAMLTGRATLTLASCLDIRCIASFFFSCTVPRECSVAERAKTLQHKRRPTVCHMVSFHQFKEKRLPRVCLYISLQCTFFELSSLRAWKCHCSLSAE